VIYAIVLTDSHTIDFDPGVRLHSFVFLSRSKNYPRVNSLSPQKPAQYQRLVEAFRAVKTAPRRHPHQTRRGLG
jgi:hypothetical protein